MTDIGRSSRSYAVNGTGRVAGSRRVPEDWPEYEYHPRVRAAAAAAKVASDRLRGVETPQWIVDLADTCPRI